MLCLSSLLVYHTFVLIYISRSILIHTHARACAHTYTHTDTYTQDTLLSNYIYSPFFLSLTTSFSFSQDTRDRLCNVLANMHSTRYSVVSSEHGGCLQLLITFALYYTWASCASQGIRASVERAGADRGQEECRDGFVLI